MDGPVVAYVVEYCFMKFRDSIRLTRVHQRRHRPRRKPVGEKRVLNDINIWILSFKIARSVVLYAMP